MLKMSNGNSPADEELEKNHDQGINPVQSEKDKKQKKKKGILLQKKLDTGKAFGQKAEKDVGTVKRRNGNQVKNCQEKIIKGNNGKKSKKRPRQRKKSYGKTEDYRYQKIGCRAGQSHF